MIELDDIDQDEDGALTALVELPGGRRVTVEYEFEEEFERDDDDDDEDDDDDQDIDQDIAREDLPDMDAMQSTVRHALARLTQETLDQREQEVAEELTDAAYEGDDDADLEEALRALKADIALDGVIVFGDGGITLLYVAPEEYPDLIIYCLLDEDLEIEDLMVE